LFQFNTLPKWNRLAFSCCFTIVFFVFLIFFFGKNINRSKVENFKTSDYELNKDERQAKYKDYDYGFCEKCNQEIDHKLNYV